ncbi:hypothetical protein [Sulfitobacter sp. R86518]|uniref:hypothetical protein n=1 Tax=Sulfitobacter sp. R86518 TaxID=3093858 RepID=UPI0036DAFA5D
MFIGPAAEILRLVLSGFSASAIFPARFMDRQSWTARLTQRRGPARAMPFSTSFRSCGCRAVPFGMNLARHYHPTKRSKNDQITQENPQRLAAGHTRPQLELVPFPKRKKNDPAEQ